MNKQTTSNDFYNMTKEEKLKYRTQCAKNAIKEYRYRQALEQDSSEDAISRILKRMWNCRGKHTTSIDKVKMEQILREELPPVNPQEPKTVLYSGDGYADGYMVYDMAECPSCGYEYEDGDKDWGLSFCPNCGQKLNWESEDKE